MTELAQQGEVLHVPGADLEDVAVAVEEFELADIHHLGDEREVLGL